MGREGNHQRNKDHYKERQHQSQQPGGEKGKQQDQYQQTGEQKWDQQDQSQQSEEHEWSSDSHAKKDAPKGEMDNYATSGEKTDRGNQSSTDEKHDAGGRGNPTINEDSDPSRNTQREDSGLGDKKDSNAKRQ
ncbi:MAG TPA: hypothetical protein VK856_02260 [Anaerolineaceae bacterium]|nr:hypothetical protein [Anaerolineaceae bacterium]